MGNRCYSLLSRMSGTERSRGLGHKLMALMAVLTLLSAGSTVGLAPAAAAPGDTLVADTDTLNFGDVTLGNNASQAITITNTSDSDVTITAAGGAAPAPFTGATSCNGTTLTPTQTCQFVYTFTPTTLGPATATTSFTLNGTPFPVNLTGTGVEATDPTDPTDPTTPAVPTEPTEPTSPAVPTEPTEPTSPAGPTDPTAPTGPVTPVASPSPRPGLPHTGVTGSGAQDPTIGGVRGPLGLSTLILSTGVLVTMRRRRGALSVR